MSTPNVNTSPATTAPTQNQDRLAQFFASHAAPTHPSRWDDLWKAGDFLPWDRGSANPALIDTLNANPEWLPAAKKEDGTRRRAFVPGCGKGYDLALFAAYGYDACGLEVSANAVKAAKSWLREMEDGETGEYKVHDESVGEGKMGVVEGDFFEGEWMEGVGGLGDGFDIIYDNTFLSALPPSLRAPWAARMAQLLSPTGVLICLEFPTHKPPKSGGPPWALPSDVYVELFKRPGEEIQYDEDMKVVRQEREESDTALQRIAYWTPERTHAVGVIKGIVKDRVSVWRHK